MAISRDAGNRCLLTGHRDELRSAQRRRKKPTEADRGRVWYFGRMHSEFDDFGGEFVEFECDRRSRREVMAGNSP